MSQVSFDDTMEKLAELEQLRKTMQEIHKGQMRKHLPPVICFQTVTAAGSGKKSGSGKIRILSAM